MDDHTIESNFASFKRDRLELFDNTTVKHNPHFAHYLEARLFEAFQVGARVGYETARVEIRQHLLSTLVPDR